MKLVNVIITVLAVIMVILTTYVAWNTPTGHVRNTYSFRLCDDYAIETRQHTNIFGVRIGEEYTLYVPN